MASRRRARRGNDDYDGSDDGFDGDPGGGEPGPEIDLHGLRPEEALRRLALAVHTARVRGCGALLVVTGRGWGNERNEPVLRTKVEHWTRTPDARERGVLGFERSQKGGALRLRLKARPSA
jgi:DNA-nicking Smr family endonuclease